MIRDDPNVEHTLDGKVFVVLCTFNLSEGCTVYILSMCNKQYTQAWYITCYVFGPFECFLSRSEYISIKCLCYKWVVYGSYSNIYKRFLVPYSLLVNSCSFPGVNSPALLNRRTTYRSSYALQINILNSLYVYIFTFFR